MAWSPPSTWSQLSPQNRSPSLRAPKSFLGARRLDPSELLGDKQKQGMLVAKNRRAEISQGEAWATCLRTRSARPPTPLGPRHPQSTIPESLFSTLHSVALLCAWQPWSLASWAHR